MSSKIKGKWIIIDYSQIENAPSLSAYDNHIDTSAIHFEQEEIEISSSQVTYDNTETQLLSTNVQDVIDELNDKIEFSGEDSWTIDGVTHIKPKDNKLVKVEHIDGAVNTSTFHEHISTSAIHFEKTDIDYSDIQNTPSLSDYDNHINTSAIHFEKTDIDYSDIQNTPDIPDIPSLSAYDEHINTSAIHFEKTDISASDIQYSSSELSATNVRDGLNELKKNIDDLDASSWEVDGLGYIKPKDNKLVKVEHIEGAINTSAFDSHINDGDIHFTQETIDYNNIQNTPDIPNVSAFEEHINTSAIHFEKTDIDYSDIQNTPDIPNVSAFEEHINTSAIHFEKTDIDYSDIQNTPDIPNVSAFDEHINT